MNPINCEARSSNSPSICNCQIFAEGNINDNAEVALQFDKAKVNCSTFTGRKYLILHFKIHVDEATKFALNL